MNNDSKIKFAPYDLKSKATKYKRWTPKMDLYFVSLLSDVVHSYPKDQQPQLTKKGWGYICNNLRLANPQTVYSTYTKYSCSQHLFNVIHSRYKLWCTLMIHSTSGRGANDAYSFKWNPNTGNFQIIVVSDNQVITDEGIIKSIIYGESLPLPSLEKFHKGNIVVNDFFLSTNFSYMSEYHNEILPMLMAMDPMYAEGLETVYQEIPKFEYPGYNREYQKPLVVFKPKKGEKFDVTDDYGGKIDLGLELHSADFHDGYFPGHQEQSQQHAHQQHQGSPSHQQPNHPAHQQQQVIQHHQPHNQNDAGRSQSPSLARHISDQISSSISSSMSPHVGVPDTRITSDQLKRPLHHAQSVSNLNSNPGHNDQHNPNNRALQQASHMHPHLQRHNPNPNQAANANQAQVHPGHPPPHLNHPPPPHPPHGMSELHIDSSIKRSRVLSNDFGGDIAHTVMGDFNAQGGHAHSPNNGQGNQIGFTPAERSHPSSYQKDRPWFNKLMYLHESGLITLHDFFTILEGVRDNKFPSPLLNILDPGAQSDKFSDEEITKRVKIYILPLCESLKGS